MQHAAPRSFWLCLIAAIAGGWGMWLAPTTAQAQAATEFAAADLDFFEKKIRPVLVEHCQKCHSAEAAATNQLKGGLLVDSREALLVGGDSGPAVVPGNVEESLLLDALRYESFQMPPKGKLPAAVIADFQRWIERGAADPRKATTKVAKKPGIDIEAGRKHWCYQPVAQPAVPAIGSEAGGADTKANVKFAGRARGAIDAFVLARLQRAGGASSPEADRVTLARRIYFDLHGLPPSADDIATFVADNSPDAYERLVERLLSSPRFGERWGRHWLDVARFAESLTLRGFVLPEAWRYRDYVIQSFNADRSFSQMIREQIAGDLLEATALDDRRRNLVATTYLALGNTNLEEQDKQQLRMDYVDEQLETIGKGLLGQTIGCARCHDHKFDPIPTRDYYALAGIFRNSKAMEHSNVSKWLEFRLPLEPAEEAIYAKHDAAVAALQTKIRTLKSPPKTAVATAPGEKPARYYDAIIDPRDLPGVVVDDKQAKVVGDWGVSQYNKRYIGEGYLQDQNKGKGEKTITFIPELPQAGVYEVRFAYISSVSRASNVPVTIFSADGEKVVEVNQKAAPPIEGRFISLGQFRFEKNGQGFVMVANEETNGIVTVDAVQFLSADDAKPAAKPNTKASDSTAKVAADAKAVDDAKAREQAIKDLEKELKTLNETGPKRPMYMSVTDEKKIEDANIHVRGSVHNLGEKVPRGFLQVATTGSPVAISANESGRRELADWIASDSNPLTSRVIVNRAWHWLFGAGLVRTTDNFGTTGEAPSHPELLDHLTSRFLENDWSVKDVVRQIVLSSTYRQSSAIGERPLASDPENRLLWRANRRRLEGECILDAMLTTSGELRFELLGKTLKPGLAADYNYPHVITRRAIYWPVLRNSLPEILEVFDAADPSTATGRRNASTVAPQALFLLNDDWVLARSQAAAQRLLNEPLADDDARLTAAYQRTLGRAPATAERRVAQTYLANPSDQTSRDTRWSQLFQALFASLDFRYVE